MNQYNKTGNADQFTKPISEMLKNKCDFTLKYSKHITRILIYQALDKLLELDNPSYYPWHIGYDMSFKHKHGQKVKTRDRKTRKCSRESKNYKTKKYLRHSGHGR